MTFHVGGKAYAGRTHNLSRGGLCANVSDPIAVGIDLDVDVSLVFDEDAQSDALRLPSRVVWCTTLDDAYQVGVSFRPLDAQKAEYLAVFLRYLGDSNAERVPRTDKDNVDKRFG